MMFSTGAKAFPIDVIEAARLDGLNEFQIFFPYVYAHHEIYLCGSSSGNLYECME